MSITLFIVAISFLSEASDPCNRPTAYELNLRGQEGITYTKLRFSSDAAYHKQVAIQHMPVVTKRSAREIAQVNAARTKNKRNAELKAKRLMWERLDSKY